MQANCVQPMKCTYCKSLIPAPTKGQKDSMRAKGRVYCSTECGKAYAAKISSATMAETNRKYASARMTANNPMSSPESVEKMKTTLHAIGHQPHVRQGNGTGLTVPQKLLSERLQMDTEIVVQTHQPRDSGYPIVYKLDIGR